MTLWVRSQNKMSLISPNCVQYISIDGENTHCIIGSGVDLGIYDSKERCLEVLDEIQKILMTQYRIIPRELTKEEAEKVYENRYTIGANSPYSVGFDKIEIKSYVYQMPKE